MKFRATHIVSVGGMGFLFEETHSTGSRAGLKTETELLWLKPHRRGKLCGVLSAATETATPLSPQYPTPGHPMPDVGGRDGCELT